nr:MAG TPA: large terminase [Bacteriophage sp.]
MSEKEFEGFTEKQKKVLRCANKRFNILSGATRSGKTHITYFLIILRIREHYNNNILFCGKTLATLERNIFVEMRKWFGEEYIGEVKSDMSGNRMIKIFGKSCYCVGANDERAITKIQGLGLGYAYCDELTTYPENFFRMLQSRLDRDDSKCDATCNPEGPTHFVKKLIDDDPEHVYNEHFSIYDNTFLAKEFVETLEHQYRGTIYFEKWILGNWVKAEGAVYPLFRKEVHFLTPAEFSRRYGRHSIRYVIFGGDGANTNDATALVPLAIMDNGQAVRLEMFYHNPKINGQLSNEQLVPYIQHYLQDLQEKYRFRENGVEFVTTVDCAAADLVLTLAYRLPPEYNVQKFTKKDILQTTDVVNNALSRRAVCILDFGGYFNYVRNEFVAGDDQLVIDLENMVWDKKNNRKYDDTVPNDCADAFRYALNTYYNNPFNLWETPSMSEFYKGD